MKQPKNIPVVPKKELAHPSALLHHKHTTIASPINTSFEQIFKTTLAIKNNIFCRTAVCEFLMLSLLPVQFYS